MKLLYYLRTLFKCIKNILTTWKYLDTNDIMNETNILERNLCDRSHSSLPRTTESMIPTDMSGLMDMMISTLENLKLIDDCIPGGFCKKYFLSMTKGEKLIFWSNKLRELNMLGKISATEVGTPS